MDRSQELSPSTGFALDTSGFVAIDGVRVYWSVETAASGIYLNPFTQGYVAALLGNDALNEAWALGFWQTGRRLGFADLAPETLALILKDCAAVTPFYADHHGLDFWTERQQGEHQPDFPPQTVTLGDNGKVRTSSAEQVAVTDPGIDQ